MNKNSEWKRNQERRETSGEKEKEVGRQVKIYTGDAKEEHKQSDEEKQIEGMWKERKKEMNMKNCVV